MQAEAGVEELTIDQPTPEQFALLERVASKVIPTLGRPGSS